MAEQYRKGDRIELDYSDDADPLPPGATGTVKCWHPALLTIEVDWDEPYQDRKLNVVTDADIVHKI
jgi:hypothetical protein